MGVQESARVELVANKIGIGFDPCILYYTTGIELIASCFDYSENIQSILHMKVECRWSCTEKNQISMLLPFAFSWKSELCVSVCGTHCVLYA